MYGGDSLMNTSMFVTFMGDFWSLELVAFVGLCSLLPRDVAWSLGSGLRCV